MVWTLLSLQISVTNDLTWVLKYPIDFLLLVMIYPILEEIIFRGLIQDSLNTRFNSQKIGVLSYANGITSLLFVSLHLIYHPLLWAVLIIFPSLLFGYVKERYQTLLAPILLHVFYNMGYYLLYS